MKRSPVAITGYAIVSALGWTPTETWSAMERGESGLGPLTLFTSRKSGDAPVGEVKGDPAGRTPLDAGSRSDHFAVHACGEAAKDAGLDALPESERANAGVLLGACTGGMLDSEEFLRDLLHGDDDNFDRVHYHECGSSARAVSETLGFNGYRATVSTACTSGAAAIALGCDVLEAGEADVVVAGGVDSLTRLTLNGFSSLLIVSPQGCRPFDADRDGLSLGEGCGAVVLETLDHAARRGARIRALVHGAESTCDAYHATAPSPDGEGLERAINRALDGAGLGPNAIDYINAHGTGTPDNDVVEADAIRRVFADGVPPISSVKGFFGHTLAAAGAIEAVVSVLAIENGKIPPNIRLNTPDPAVQFTPVTTMREVPITTVLSTSLGFGGNNTALIIGAAQEGGA